MALNANAKLPIPICIPCEKIALVKELPDDSSNFRGDMGDKLDIGYMYNEYGALWIPAWNTTGTYVLTNKEKNTFYDISTEELAILTKKYNLKVTENPLSIWQKIGGKIVLAILFLFLVFRQLVRK